MGDTNTEQKNFIEARMIIQEFHDDTNVFVVGTAPFGKLWFDHEKVSKQYKVLTDSWYEEYGDNETKHSKRPRIINILIDESDPMFNKYRDNIREAQNKKDDEKEESDKEPAPVNEVVQPPPAPVFSSPAKTEEEKTEKVKKPRKVKKKEPETPAPEPEKKETKTHAKRKKKLVVQADKSA
jgi:hypothetical protein